MSTDCAHKSPRALLGSSPPPTVAQWTDGRSGWWGAPPLDYGSTELTPQVSPDSFLEILTYQLPRFSGAPSINTHTHTHTFAKRKQAFRCGVGNGALHLCFCLLQAPSGLRGVAGKEGYSSFVISFWSLLGLQCRLGIWFGLEFE
jgi:hypothetical protein